MSDTHAAHKNRFLSTQSVLGLPTSCGYLVFDELLVGTFEEAFTGRRTLLYSFLFRYTPLLFLIYLKKKREKKVPIWSLVFFPYRRSWSLRRFYFLNIIQPQLAFVPNTLGLTIQTLIAPTLCVVRIGLPTSYVQGVALSLVHCRPHYKYPQSHWQTHSL